jgi:hypothetical protein
MNVMHTTETLAGRAGEADELARSIRTTAIDLLRRAEMAELGFAVDDELRSIVAGLANLSAKVGSLAVELDDPARAVGMLHELAARVSGMPPRDAAGEIAPPHMYVHAETGAVVVVFPGSSGKLPAQRTVRAAFRAGSRGLDGNARVCHPPSEAGELVGRVLELDHDASSLEAPR